MKANIYVFGCETPLVLRFDVTLFNTILPTGE